MICPVIGGFDSTVFRFREKALQLFSNSIKQLEAFVGQYDWARKEDNRHNASVCLDVMESQMVCDCRCRVEPHVLIMSVW